MISRLIFTLGLFFVLSIATLSAVSPAQPTREQLETQKLELEIEKMREDLNKGRAQAWVFPAAQVVSFCALLWTVFYGIKTLGQSTKRQREERISKLLEILSAERQSQRVGAARALSQYSSEALHDLLTAAATERDIEVRGAIEDSMASVGKHEVERVMQANASFLRKSFELLGQLDTGDPSSEVQGSEIFSSPNARSAFYRHYRVEYQHGQLLKSQGAQTEGAVGTAGNDAVQCLRHQAAMRDLTAAVISRWIREARDLKWPESGLVLRATNLYRGEISRMHLRCGVFTSSIMRHLVMAHCELIMSDFGFSNLFDARIRSCVFEKCYFSSARLGQLVAVDSTFDECIFDGASLARANLTGAKIRHCTASKAILRGAILPEADFSHSEFNRCEFHGATLVGACLDSAKLYGSKFIAANLTKTRAPHAKFNGTDLTNAKFRKADLQNADFSGADLKHADFEGANLSGAKFVGCKNQDAARHLCLT